MIRISFLIYDLRLMISNEERKMAGVDLKAKLEVRSKKLEKENGAGKNGCPHHFPE